MNVLYLKVMNKATVSSGTTSSILIYMCLEAVPEGEERERWTEKLLEKIMAEMFSNQMKIMNPQSTEVQET